MQYILLKCSKWHGCPGHQCRGGTIGNRIRTWPQLQIQQLAINWKDLKVSAKQLWAGGRISYREFMECRYIRLFRISKSISYRTSHIEYLDMPSICLYFVFFRRKFSEKSENSLEIPKILRKFRKFSENSENSQKFLKIRRKF